MGNYDRNRNAFSTWQDARTARWAREESARAQEQAEYVKRLKEYRERNPNPPIWAVRKNKKVRKDVGQE